MENYLHHHYDKHAQQHNKNLDEISRSIGLLLHELLVDANMPDDSYNREFAISGYRMTLQSIQNQIEGMREKEYLGCDLIRDGVIVIDHRDKT